MTEQQENVEQSNGINITVEQILASVINTVGPVVVPLEKLIENYGNRSISVNQNEDKSVEFSLVENAQVVEETSQETVE